VARWAAAAICGYEVTAIATGKVPTVTRLCQQHPVLAPALLTALAVHLYWRPVPAAEAARG
jgi:hypothetical protein